MHSDNTASLEESSACKLQDGVRLLVMGAKGSRLWFSSGNGVLPLMLDVLSGFAHDGAKQAWRRVYQVVCQSGVPAGANASVLG